MEKEVAEILLKIVGSFKGKECLDIGTRNGLNMLTLMKYGATKCTGIDLDDTRFGEFDKYKLEYPQVRLLKMNLYDMPSNKKYDIISVFLWSMPFHDYDKIILKIKDLLCPGGMVLIGVYDDVYKQHYPFDGCFIYQTFNKHFKSCRLLKNNDYDNNSSGQWIFVLSV